DFILLGAQNQAELSPLADSFFDLGYQVLTATDDGSLGHLGFVTDLLDDVLANVKRVYTCGPFPMMRIVKEKCKKADVLCDVSLETHMACGLGACLGCTVMGADGNYVHVCKQGPVFSAGEIAWTL
ncbi:MAG: dihydroorotate dehydrogenase electron transfer subunit, partial [Desulfobulbaceae bacterium]|nr:dihydroorotate dehydrogenase electron transfer subunit [Desulfobulbaceae bacterium]